MLSVDISYENTNYIQPAEKLVTCDDFQLIKKLGTGGYGQVFLAKKLDGKFKDEPFALKVISKAKLLNKNRDRLYAKIEKDILSSINCPFLISLYYAFDNEDFVFFCLEYLSGGELFSQLERKVYLIESECRFYAAEVICAIAHLHQLSIVYRDVKSENILLDRYGHVKLTDFGLSKILLDPKRTRTFCGTIEYMAPEVVAKKEYSFEVDWWSMGILLHDMMVGGSPFSSDNKERVIKKILNGKYCLPNYLSSAAKSLIKRFLVHNPVERLGYRSVEDIKRHRFFKDLNWSKLYAREIHPPFVPSIQDDFDVSLFDPKVLEEPCELVYVEYLKQDADAFADFSYVAPFVSQVHLRETWMVCDDEDSSSSDSSSEETCLMEYGFIEVSQL